MNLIFIVILFTRVLFAFGNVFRDTLDEIFEVQEDCYKTLGEEMTCEVDECVLKAVYLLDGTGNNVKMTRMNALYRPIATQCMQNSQSPSTCEFSYKFLQCFIKWITDYEEDYYSECAKRYPIDKKEMEMLEMSEESFKKVKNHACLMSCASDVHKIYTENDEFNKNSLRLHSNLPIDVLNEAENCYKQHQQEDKCQRRANRTACLYMKYMAAQEKANSTGYDNLSEEIYE